tara:strand:- start:2337 stop:2501 length:165 start_codon:yes stop_codon:yes gene_type:complete
MARAIPSTPLDAHPQCNSQNECSFKEQFGLRNANGIAFRVLLGISSKRYAKAAL